MAMMRSSTPRVQSPTCHLTSSVYINLQKPYLSHTKSWYLMLKCFRKRVWQRHMSLTLLCAKLSRCRGMYVLWSYWSTTQHTHALMTCDAHYKVGEAVARAFIIQLALLCLYKSARSLLETFTELGKVIRLPRVLKALKVNPHVRGLWRCSKHGYYVSMCDFLDLLDFKW